MTTRSAEQMINADPESVLAVLTDPGTCGRWTPIDFSTELSASARLQAGTRTIVEGRIAGQRAEFLLEVHRADRQQLALTASGPVTIQATYHLAPSMGGTHVRAEVGVASGRGLSGKLLARAAEAVLAGGAVSFALRRIANEAELCCAQADSCAGRRSRSPMRVASIA